MENTSKKPALSVMLDSGAYSAWKMRNPIKVEDYIDYVKDNQHLFSSIVALDVIPGEGGQMAKTAEAVELSASASHKNLQKMVRAGLSPIPVFHMGESFKWLDRLLDEGHPYIGISPYLTASQSSIIRWLDQCFTRTTTADGVPLVKTHGFGVTSYGLVTRYPWYSIDSTSYALWAGYGMIIVPQFIGGKPRYDRYPLLVTLSDRDESSSTKVNLANLGDHAFKIMTNYFEEIGYPLANVRNNNFSRMAVNINYFMKLQKSMKLTPFKHRVASGLLSSVDIKKRKPVVPFDFTPRVFFATSCRYRYHNLALAAEGAGNRLLSYYLCRDEPEGRVSQWCSDGVTQHSGRKLKPWTESYNVHRRMSLIARYAKAAQDEDAF